MGLPERYNKEINLRCPPYFVGVGVNVGFRRNDLYRVYFNTLYFQRQPYSQTTPFLVGVGANVRYRRND